MPQGFDTDSMSVVSRELSSAMKQVGTLGGGNHFIELQRHDALPIFSLATTKGGCG